MDLSAFGFVFNKLKACLKAWLPDSGISFIFLKELLDCTFGVYFYLYFDHRLSSLQDLTESEQKV